MRTSEFEILITYKSSRDIHRATYPSRIYMLVVDMELFIIFAQGVSPRVVIWLRERQDFLGSMVLTATGIPWSVASIVGDVLEKGRHEA